MRFLTLFIAFAGCSPSSGTPTPDASGDLTSGPKRVFVTSSTFKGDLRTAGGGSDGLDGGDRLCNMAAASGKLGATFTAWLSSSSTDALSRIAGSGPWQRTDGSPAFADRSALAASPAVNVDKDENGALVVAVTTVWTGTLQGGTHSSQTCADWTDATAGNMGLYGIDGAAMGWTSTGTNPCTQSSHLYCFEN